MPAITLKHNMEVAHRLLNLPGKCRQIHGHSMVVELKLYVQIDIGYAVNGILEVLDFGDVKRSFRKYIDEKYDHHLLLNQDDPWAQPIETVEAYANATGAAQLPGLVPTPGDPSVENLATWIAEWAAEEFICDVEVTIHETATNSVSVGASPSAQTE